MTSFAQLRGIAWSVVMDSASNSSSEAQIKRKRLSLALPKKANRFAAPTSSNDLKKVCEDFVLVRIQRCTTWLVRTVETWKNDRNKMCEDKCPDDLFENASISALNKWLSAFVVEARREDGKRYPATTITNRRFNYLNGALKSVFHKLTEDGTGAVVKHATVVTPQEEELLWSTGTIGVSSPLSLQRAVFYYVGKVLCLRGGEEQRSLKISQFRREKDSYVLTAVFAQVGAANRLAFLGKARDSLFLFICASEEEFAKTACFCTMFAATAMLFLHNSIE